MNAALPFAQQQLAKNGEFYPYGVLLTSDGDGERLGGWTGDEHPLSDEVLLVLLDEARLRSTTLRAVALVADVRAKGGDAIRVELEHREGPVMTILLGYSRRRFGRGIEYGAMTAGAAERRIWAPSGEGS